MELGTKARALSQATKLLQAYGYNGFSFQHVADELGIKKQSLYVHFKSKEELGIEAIESYRNKFVEWTKTVESFEPLAQLSAHFDVFHKFCTEGRRYCLFGSLSADFNSLPKSMQKSLTKSLLTQREWLEGLILKGQKNKSVRKDLTPAALARTILAMIYGSQVIGRALLDPNEIQEIKQSALLFLKA